MLLACSGIWVGFNVLWSQNFDQDLGQALQSEKETRSRLFNTVFAGDVVERRVDRLRSTAEAFLSDEASEIANIQIYDAAGRKLADVGAVRPEHICDSPDELSLDDNHTFLQHEVDLDLEGMGAGRLVYVRSYRGLLELHTAACEPAFGSPLLTLSHSS